jgi:glycosyltransferase involved in cell wall biosynthesis
MPEVERYYQAADLLVLPSRQEPFGRVVLEAMAAGLLSIVSEDAGVAPYMKRISPSLVFRPGDAGALARAVVHGMNADQKKRAQWIKSGRAVLAQTFAAQVVVPKLEQVYLQVIAGAAAKSNAIQGAD